MSDSLRIDELAPVGGTWTGLLFENPTTGYPLALSWTFSVNYAEVSRDYGSVSPNIEIDWVPAGGSGWQAMRDQHFACSRFGEPIETSVYFFEHHRYDAVELIVTGQRGAQLSVQAKASGDIDGLGIPEIFVDATVAFGGIYVQTDAVGADTGSAAELLGRFTDVDGLRPAARGHNVVFEPSD